MKLTVVAAGLILAILFVSYDSAFSRVMDRIDRSEIGPTVGASHSSNKAQGRQGFPEDDYYEEEEDDEEEEELQQSLQGQDAGAQSGGGGGGVGGFEEEEDDNEDDEGDEEDEEEDEQDEQRFMEDKRFLKAVYDIL